MSNRSISQTDKANIAQLFELGKTDTEIAASLNWTHKNAVRCVAMQRKKMGLYKGPYPHKPAASNISPMVKTTLLETMSKDERVKFLKLRFDANPRNQLVLHAFSKEEMNTFLDQYYNIIQSTDSLTEAEEQQLFAAIVEYILAFRALRAKSEEEQCVAETLAGDNEKGDPRYILKVDKRHDEEYNSHLQNYQSFMSELKMSRKQRLDKVKSEKRTLIDVASELATQTEQASAIDEIERLANLEDEELKRLIDNKYLLGFFGKK